MTKKFAYFTLASSDPYINGAIGLAYSLKQVNTSYPLIVGVSNCSNTAISLLEDSGIKYIKIPNDVFNCQSRYNVTIQKFYLLNLTEYEKIMFLDVDAIVLSNLDQYFFLPFEHSFTFNKNGSIHGAFFIISPSKFLSYNEIKEKFLNNKKDDEELLKSLGLENPDLIYSNLLFTPNQFLYTGVPGREKDEQIIENKEAILFHDNSSGNRKLFLNFNYFLIIDYLQQNKKLPPSLIGDFLKFSKGV